MAAAALVVGLIGTAVSVYGAYQQAQSQQQAAEFNAQVQQNNEVAAQAEGQAQAVQDARQTALMAGTVQANQGASGGQMQGSALDVLGDVTAQGNLQQQTDQYNAALKGMGYQNSATADNYTASTITPGLSAAAALVNEGSRFGGTLYSLTPPNQGAPLTNMG